jgi:hypothetical protein
MERLGKTATSTGRPEVERMGDERIKSQYFDRQLVATTELSLV